MCPHELANWRDGPEPVFNCRDIHPNTVKPANLDIALRDPLKVRVGKFYNFKFSFFLGFFLQNFKTLLKVFLVRFYDSGKESSRTHKIWNRLVEQIDRKQIYNYIIPYQVNCDCDELTRKYCQHEQALENFPDVVAYKNAKEIQFLKYIFFNGVFFHLLLFKIVLH